jgi:acyl-CoA reductase-like NAD-dependent aldehyde dehydrogenase
MVSLAHFALRRRTADISTSTRPWRRNYPIHNALSPILAALFAGNSIVVKCSEQVYWSSKWVVGAMKKALSVCGMDEDAVQVRGMMVRVGGGTDQTEYIRW